PTRHQCNLSRESSGHRASRAQEFYPRLRQPWSELADRPESKYELRSRSATGGSMSFTGEWKIVIDSPMGKQESSITLAENGSALAGRQSSAFGEGDILNGSVDGNKAKWSVEMTSPFRLDLAFSAVVDGDAISGVVNAGAFGDSPFRGSRA